MITKGTKLELIGMSIALLSAAWGIFVEGTLRDDMLDNYFYRIEEKLFPIWGMAAHEFVRNPQNNAKTGFTFNLDAVAHSWKDWREGDKELRSQYNISSMVSGLSFLIGSFLLIFGKYLDAVHSQAGRNQLHN